MGRIVDIFEVRLLRRAQLDLEDLIDGMEAHRPGSGRAFAKKLQIRLARLQRFPNSGSPLRDAQMQALGFRFVSSERVLVFHTVDMVDRKVYVHRVLAAHTDYLQVLRTARPG